MSWFYSLWVGRNHSIFPPNVGSVAETLPDVAYDVTILRHKSGLRNSFQNLYSEGKHVLTGVVRGAIIMVI